jgi:ribonucleotide reductase alpha subunit
MSFLSQDEEMYVTKRNGQKEIVSFDKILTRIKKIGAEAHIKLNYTSLVMKVIDQLFDGISTTKIDELSAEQCASMASIHPDYNTLAGRIVVSNHHKNTHGSFVEVMSQLYECHDKHNKPSPLLSKELYFIVNSNEEVLNAMCDYSRDYLIDYFGFKTLERAYLMKLNKVIVERPQHMWLRVALGIHGNNLEKVRETYDLMSLKYFTHATPTLFNAGTPHPQLSSCYLIAMESDSMEGIYNTLKDCAMISKWAGGIGLHIHNVRASGSSIRGTNGNSSGIVPMLKVFNNTAKFVDQGGKRNGSFAIYLEPWHADIEMFLQMRKNHGDEELKARDLFYALWVPDLFMERIKTDGTWTLMCPDECPGLSDVYGDEFKILYTKYETEGKGRKTMKARDLWFQVLDAQMETGTPYLLYKDACNKKSNQQNVGIIKSSNLCVAPETTILTDNGHIEIQTLVGKKVNVWNGEEFSEVEIFKTGENQELIDVYTSDGCKLTCTKYHKFFIQKSESVEIVRSSHLSIGDSIIEWKNIDGTVQPSVKIEKIVDKGRIDDTYCFTEPLRSAGIFNGIITSQCTEILEYSDENETAVCNLASIALPTFVDQTQEPFAFDYDKLHEITKVVTYNLNRIIDINFYPTPKTERSNLRHRPIGIGVQGLADVFMLLNVPFHSDEAKAINRKIFETIYHAALERSMEIAKIEGPYETFEGSPASKGLLQFDLWNINPCENETRYDWDDLKQKIINHGLRNSLLVAPMPTASTSQILGFNECIEPITSNIYNRRTLAGEFILANKYLMNDLIELDLWNEKIKNNIIANHGSIQHIEIIPQHIRDKYKTVWEIPMRHLIDMAADRGAYICQSQSLNLWLEDPNYSMLTSMHFYSWSKGLKTGIYYLRRRGRHHAQQFTIEPEKTDTTSGQLYEDDEICEMCSA